MQFTYTELQVLAGLADRRTITQIGQQLALSHSAISRALHVAQQRAGVQLFERDGRRLRLTLAGHDLALRAAVAVHEIDEVSRLADAQRAGSSGVVRILAVTTTADYLLPAVIAEFVKAAPFASVVLRTLTAADEPLERFDVRIGPPEPTPPGWQSTVLYVDELVFFVSARHPLAERSHLTWADLQSRTLVGPNLEPYWPRYWAHMANPPRLPRSTVDAASSESVKRVVEHMDAIGVAVRSALRDGLASGQFVALPASESRIQLPYILMHRSGVRLLPLVEQFLSILVDHASRF